jgi:hypothetical protein
VAQLGAHEVPFTAIHRAYLAAFDHMLLAETLAQRERGRFVMDACLPFVLAQSFKEGLLDKREQRGGTNRGPKDQPLGRLLQDVFSE